jgi:peptide/nickel transport system permease protein
VLGILTGIKSSEKVYSLTDNVNTIFSLLLWAMPGFWFAMILIQVLAVNFDLLPAQSIVDIGVVGFERIKSLILHLIMPITVLSLGGFASYTRYTRTSMLEVLKKDYILTAWSKGATPKMVYRKHAFRNAALPLITLIALRMRGLFMGSVLIETVFSYPGLGMLLYKSISRRDYNVIQGIFLIYTILTLLSNIVADVAYAYLDPRIRYGDED